MQQNEAIGGRPAPTVGAVTMDMTLVDVTDRPDVNEGDEAVILGGGDAPSAWDLAAWSGQIPYEILCGIGPRVTRRAGRASTETHDSEPRLTAQAG